MRFTAVQFWQTERKRTRQRGQADEYTYQNQCSLLRFPTERKRSNITIIPAGWSMAVHPTKRLETHLYIKLTRISKQTSKYNKDESKITFADVEDCLDLGDFFFFQSVTSYENQTKKAITNKGIQEAMTEMLRHTCLKFILLENPYGSGQDCGTGT